MRFAFVIVVLSAGNAFAQQSLFNVPSTQETVKGRLFGQVQLTGTPHGGEVNTTIELGILRWLEIGMNLFHMPLYRVSDVEEPGATASSATTVNANVWFDPASWFAIEIGGQGGVGFAPGSHLLEPVLFGWATARFEAPGRWGSYVVGGYTGTRGALGHGPPAGGLFGFEIPLWEHYIHAQGDWVIGLNAISVAVVGVVIFIGKNFQLSLGGQLPSPGSGNGFGGVVELTYVPSHPEDDEGIGSPEDRPHRPRTGDQQK